MSTAVDNVPDLAWVDVASANGDTAGRGQLHVGGVDVDAAADDPARPRGPGFANGWPLVGNELVLGTEANMFAGQARHGIKLNPAGAGVHRCRRFVAKN